MFWIGRFIVGLESWLNVLLSLVSIASFTLSLSFFHFKFASSIQKKNAYDKFQFPFEMSYHFINAVVPFRSTSFHKVSLFLSGWNSIWINCDLNNSHKYTLTNSRTNYRITMIKCAVPTSHIHKSISCNKIYRSLGVFLLPTLYFMSVCMFG